MKNGKRGSCRGLFVLCKRFYRLKIKQMKRIYKQKKTIIIILGFFVIFISFIYLNVERDRVGKIETVSFTSLCSIFSLFVACGALGYAVRGQPELLEAVKEVTKAIQDLRKAIIEQGIKTTIPR